MLLLLAALEFLSFFRKTKQATSANRYILMVTVPVTVGSVISGWLLAGPGGYEEQLLFFHRWTGVGVAVATLALWWVHCRGWQTIYRVLIALITVLTVVAGHLGGSLTHGKGFLTSGFGEKTGAATVTEGAPVGFAVVEPMLSEYCYSCHGPEKVKGGLRVDSLAFLLQGGDSGPSIVAGDPDASLLLQRLMLPLEDDDRMPPEGKPQPTEAEVAALRTWLLSVDFQALE
jgi:hypothetical protein